MALIYNATFDKNTRKLAFEDKSGNEIYSFTVPERAPAVDDITKPLTFRATQDGSVVRIFKGRGSPSGSFQTSRDGGNTWTDYTLNTAITLNTSDEVSFRAKADRSAQTAVDYFSFGMTGKIEAWHNVMSLYRTNDFATYNTTPGTDTFNSLFYECRSLTKAPVLPATTITDSCYYRMFCGTSLTKAPELPATTLDRYCYSYMFSRCQSLTKAPELPATTLALRCYDSMFYECQSLKEVRVSATKTAQNALDYWLAGVSATGDFYCDPNATIFPTGSASGIPKNWRRLNIDEEAPAVDDPNKPLMLRAIEDNSSVALNNMGPLDNTYQTSTNGTDWTDYTLGTKISLNKGESVYFRCSNHPTTQSHGSYVYFVMTGKVEAWHNAYSMISSDFSSAEASVGEYGMNGLFEHCSSLTKAPLLLNALSPYCYIGTFWDCGSLTKAPSLPATNLAEGCYQAMFQRCESLTKAPELPATNLAEKCYQIMFDGCRSLNEVRISATTTAATDSLYNWLKEVSATGDFYCKPNATIFPSGISGIPANWTRRNIADYPN